MGLIALMMFKYVRNQATNFQNKNGLKRSNPLSGVISLVEMVILGVVMNKNKNYIFTKSDEKSKSRDAVKTSKCA